VDYETKLRAEKQDSKQEGLEEGIQVGKQEGLEEGLKIAVTLNRLRNQGADVNTVKENIKIVAPSLSPEKVDELIKEYYK
jgi:flagellar biosynthesis/type III secretory pathway protein FliH